IVEQHGLDRRVYGKPAIAEQPALDFDRREFRQVPAAREQMLRPDALPARRVEHDRLAGRDVGGRRAQAPLAPAEPRYIAGACPAMIAALMAPVEAPAIQSGRSASCACKAAYAPPWYAPRPMPPARTSVTRRP